MKNPIKITFYQMKKKEINNILDFRIYMALWEKKKKNSKKISTMSF
jgi:hypothetical protein